MRPEPQIASEQQASSGLQRQKAEGDELGCRRIGRLPDATTPQRKRPDLHQNDNHVKGRCSRATRDRAAPVDAEPQPPHRCDSTEPIDSAGPEQERVCAVSDWVHEVTGSAG